MITETRDGIEISFIDAGEDLPAEFTTWLATRRILGFDVETGGTDPLDPWAPGFGVRMVGVSSERAAWVLHGDRVTDIADLLTSDRTFVAFNAAFDVLAVKRAYGVAPRAVLDAFLLALMVYPPAGSPEDIYLDITAGPDDEEAEGYSAVLASDERHRLKPLSVMTGSRALADADEALKVRFAELEPRPRGSEECNAVREWMGRGYATCPVEDSVYWTYNGLDAVFGMKVLRWLLAQWEGAPSDIRRLLANESELGSVLEGITWRGLRVDREALTSVLFGAIAAQTEMKPRFEPFEVANPDSPPQVAAALQALGVVSPVISDAGQISTDKKRGLPRLREPDQPEAVRALAALLVEWRGHKALRMKTREVDRLSVRSVDGRVHPSVNALKARTGRMSIARPALQNLPKRDQRIRAVFLAEDGHVLVGADFSQIEYRVAAALSRDPAMTDVFRRGIDLHDNTAALLFGPEFTEDERGIAKNAGFGTLYGVGPKKFAAMTGLTVEAARNVIDTFFASYPGLREYVEKTQNDTEIVSLAGRRTAIDPEKAYASTNYHVQGTARDLFADALLNLRAAGWGDALWLVIHDEIILQVREDQVEAAKAALVDAMTSTFRGIPITAEPKVFGRRWGQLPEQTAEESAANETRTAA